jgi:hypothetical protein
VSSFSGKGLVPDDIAGTVHFLIAVGLAPAQRCWSPLVWGFPSPLLIA